MDRRIIAERKRVAAKDRSRLLQRCATSEAQPTAGPPIVAEVLQSNGQPLDTATRASMELRFGHDFAHVRIHTDERAAHSAAAVNAHAYTVGSDVVFGAGRYLPDSGDGRRLIAHELTHVVQQAAGPVAGVPTGNGLAVSDPTDAFEQAAEATAEQMMSGDTTSGAEQRRAQRKPAGLRGVVAPRHIQRDTGDGQPDAIPLNAHQSGGSGSTTIHDPTQRHKTYHARTLADLDRKLPDEVGSVEFRFTVHPQGDPITSARVDVTQLMTMPRWAEYDRQCQPVKQAWDSFLSALTNHEDGHVAIDGQQFAIAHQRFIGAAHSETQALSAALQADVQAAQDQYDADTDHGRRQNPPTTLDTSVTCSGTSTETGDLGELAPATAETSPPTTDAGATGIMQAKLDVSQPDDPYEREADQVADAIMNSPVPDLSWQPASDLNFGRIPIHTGERAAQSAEVGNERTYELPHVMHDRAGDDASTRTLYRWTMPFVTLKSDAELLKDGCNGDVTAIKEISNFNIATNNERITMIEVLLKQDSFGPRDRGALERLWSSFGEGLNQMVENNLALWRASGHLDGNLFEEVPQVAALAAKFPNEVKDVVTAYLFQNRGVAVSEMERLGLPFDENAPLPDPTQQQADEIRGMQAAADTVAKLQKAQKDARNIYVGFEERARSVVAEDESPFTYWDGVRFDPFRRPESDSAPDGIFIMKTYHGSIVPYDQVKERYDDATKELTRWQQRYPALYAVSREGENATTAAFAIMNPAQARQQLAHAMRALLRDIEGTQAKLDGGDLNPLDLIPIHNQLLHNALLGGVHTTTDWSKPMAELAAQQLVKDHQFSEALKRLELQSVAAAAFLLAPLTGGASIFVLLAGLAAAGIQVYQAIQSAENYEALAQAAKTSITPGTEPVTRGQVDEAQMLAISDAVAAALAVLAVAAGAAMGGIEGPAPEGEPPVPGGKPPVPEGELPVPEAEPRVPEESEPLAPGGVATAPGGTESVVSPGRLTQSEFDQLQEIARKYNTEIDVVGSRGKGLGRNIDTNLPIGKGRNTRSDIDVRINGQVDIDSQGGLSNDLSNMGAKVYDPGLPEIRSPVPYIKITPRGGTLMR